MPTKQELDDLQTKCEWKWTKMNGVNGYAVRGRGRYASDGIFLPCAGYGLGTSLGNAGSSGNYWSSVPGSGSYDYYYYYGNAWYLDFNSSYPDTSYSRRLFGQSVRPVQEFAK